MEAARVAAGAALAVAGLTAGDLWIVPGCAAGVVVAIGPFRRLTPLGTLRGAVGLPAVIASRGVLTFAFFGMDAFVPFALTNGRGHSSVAGVVAVTAATVAWTSAAWVQQRFITRLGEAWFVRAGYLLLLPGIAVVAVSSIPDGLPYWTIHLGAVLGGFGMGCAYSAHAQLALRSVPEAAVGSTTASLQLTDNLGIALGTGVVCAVVAFGDDAGWLVGDALAIALLVPASAAACGIWLAGRLSGSVSRRTRPT